LRKKVTIYEDDVVIPLNANVQIRDDPEVIVENCKKKYGFVCGTLLTEFGIPKESASNILRRLTADGVLKDLGYKNVKLPNRKMFHLIHMFGFVKNVKNAGR